MEYYIRIDKLNGIRGMREIALNLDARGYDDRVEYFGGGWNDNELQLVLPHLKFTNEEDALAYILAYGGTVLTEVPLREIKVHGDLS